MKKVLRIHKMIPAIKKWLESMDVDINYNVNYFFSQELRLKLSISSDCPNNDGVPDDPNFFF